MHVFITQQKYYMQIDSVSKALGEQDITLIKN